MLTNILRFGISFMLKQLLSLNFSLIYLTSVLRFCLLDIRVITVSKSSESLFALEVSFEQLH